MTSTKLLENDKSVAQIDAGSAQKDSIILDDSFKMIPETNGIKTFRVSRPRLQMTIAEDLSASYNGSPNAKKTLNISFREVDTPGKSIDSSILRKTKLES